MTDLKPCACPFCGHRGAVFSNDKNTLWWVVCNARYEHGSKSRCEGQGETKPTREEAIAAWNTRVPHPTAPDDTGEGQNLGWFSGFARKHGHHVQADWLDSFAASLSKGEQGEAVAWRWRNKPDGVWNYQEADIREWFDGGGYLKPALSASGPSGGGGWQSVPREPSDAMIQAACDATWGRGPISPEEAHRAGYVAMLHAAPSLDCGPLHAAFSKFVSAIKRAPISWETGVCCCGSDVVGHGFGDGHSPVDEGEYFISEAIKEAEAALQQRSGAVGRERVARAGGFIDVAAHLGGCGVYHDGRNNYECDCGLDEARALLSELNGGQSCP